MRGTDTDPRGKGSYGRGEIWWEATVVPTAGLLAAVFLGCVVAVVWFVLLTLALVLYTRVAGAALALVLVLLFVRARGSVSDHARLPTSVHLTGITEFAEVRVRNTVALMKGVSTPFERVCIDVGT